jgi:hypothetical protein
MEEDVENGGCAQASDCVCMYIGHRDRRVRHFVAEKERGSRRLKLLCSGTGDVPYPTCARSNIHNTCTHLHKSEGFSIDPLERQ